MSKSTKVVKKEPETKVAVRKIPAFVNEQDFMTTIAPFKEHIKSSYFVPGKQR
jgi:hypothetical protein